MNFEGATNTQSVARYTDWCMWLVQIRGRASELASGKVPGNTKGEIAFMVVRENKKARKLWEWVAGCLWGRPLAGDCIHICSSEADMTSGGKKWAPLWTHLSVKPGQQFGKGELPTHC